MSERNQSIKQEKKNYKELANERKQKQMEIIWNEVEQAPELANIVKLRKKLAQTNKLRTETKTQITTLKEEYKDLGKNIKQFILKQNKTQSKSTAPKNKK